MRSASSLRRQCAYPEVLARIKPRSERQQAAMDLGTQFHKAVELWATSGDLWQGIQACGSDEVRGWLELMAATWKPPRMALYEFPLGLSPDGGYEAVVEDPIDSHIYVSTNGAPLLTAGRADVVWCDEDAWKQRVVTIVDMKTGRYAVEQASTNLQLSALGLAAAGMYGAVSMTLGIYYARDGRFDWSDEIWMDSEEAAERWADVEKAALLDDQPRPGVHCEPCWERRLGRCKFAGPITKEEAR